MELSKHAAFFMFSFSYRLAHSKFPPLQRLQALLAEEKACMRDLPLPPSATKDSRSQSKLSRDRSMDVSQRELASDSILFARNAREILSNLKVLACLGCSLFVLFVVLLCLSLSNRPRLALALCHHS